MYMQPANMKKNMNEYESNVEIMAIKAFATTKQMKLM